MSAADDAWARLRREFEAAGTLMFRESGRVITGISLSEARARALLGISSEDVPNGLVLATRALDVEPDRLEPNERREEIADRWERERDYDNERSRG